MPISASQRQRAIGAVLGMACGDALGAPYEFGPVVGPERRVGMVGGGDFGWAPGEWTDDTSMAIPILKEIASGADLRDDSTKDAVAAQWWEWSRDAPDVGNHTRTILDSAGAAPTSGRLAALAADRFAAGHNSAGNGTLMRTTPIVLGYLDDEAGLTKAATDYALMTHGDPAGAEACVIWNQAQRHAILTGDLDIRVGLPTDPERRQYWEARIAEAQAGAPADFIAQNGWVVAALQAAWSAIATTEGTGPELYALALERAVRAGGDADTVAAIAGGLLGARWGVTAIPTQWRRMLHGWPGWPGQELLNQAVNALAGGAVPGRWPEVERMPCDSVAPRIVQHPADDGVLLGDLRGLDHLPAEVGAVVSLCRLGRAQWPAAGVAANDHVVVWLLDEAAEDSNPHLEYVLRDAAATIKRYRDAGTIVYVHCVHAHSRTPTVAAIYAAEALGRDPRSALADIDAALGGTHLNSRFRQTIDDWPASATGGG